MSLGSKHVGAILSVLMWNFYVCASYEDRKTNKMQQLDVYY
jgi:hypothetical protein